MLNTFVKREGWRTEGDHLLSLHNRKAFIAGIGGFVHCAVREKRGSHGTVGIKDFDGSIAAPLLSEALPDSRVILMRDPRDIVNRASTESSPAVGKTPTGRNSTMRTRSS